MNVKRRVIILCSICLIILIGAIIADKKLSKSYLIELKYNEVIEKMEKKESFVICLSQTTCSHCAEYKPKLSKVAKDNKIKIYYIEVNLLSDEEKDEFSKYISYTSTPATLFIQDGIEKTAANRINGSASEEKIINKLKSNGFLN